MQVKKTLRTNKLLFFISIILKINISCSNKVNNQLIKYVKCGNIRQIENILKINNDANVADHNGNSILILASMEGYTNIVRLLLNSKADPNAQNNYGRTALIVSSIRGDLKIVELLLKHNADISLKDINDNNALIWVSYITCRENIVNVLMDKYFNEYQNYIFNYRHQIEQHLPSVLVNIVTEYKILSLEEYMYAIKNIPTHIKLIKKYIKLKDKLSN